MNTLKNSRYRKMHQRLSYIASGVSFNFLHLPWYLRLAFAGEIVVFAGFFFNFFTISGGAEFGAFSRFFLLGTLLQIASMSIICVLALSEVAKQYVKERFQMPVSDATLLFFIGFIQFTIFLVHIQSLYGLSYFSKDIEFADTLAYCLVGSILVTTGGILGFRAEKKQILTTLYVDNNQTTSAQFDEYREVLAQPSGKKNMSLPV